MRQVLERRPRPRDRRRRRRRVVRQGLRRPRRRRGEGRAARRRSAPRPTAGCSRTCTPTSAARWWRPRPPPRRRSGAARRRRPRDRDARHPEPRRLGHRPRRRPRAGPRRRCSRSPGSARPGPTPTTRGATSSPRRSAASRSSTRGPVRLPMSLGETAVGHTAALAGLAAVLRAGATGVGAFVDCSAAEALASAPFRVSRYLGWEYSGHTDVMEHAPEQQRHAAAARHFPCADGYVAMMMTTQQLGEMLDRPRRATSCARRSRVPTRS